MKRWIPFKFKNKGLNDQQKRLLDGYSGGQIIPSREGTTLGQTEGGIGDAVNDRARVVRAEPNPEHDPICFFAYNSVDGSKTEFIYWRPPDYRVEFSVEYSAVVVEGDGGMSVVSIYKDDEKYSSHLVGSQRARGFAANEVRMLNERGL